MHLRSRLEEGFHPQMGACHLPGHVREDGEGREDQWPLRGGLPIGRSRHRHLHRVVGSAASVHAPPQHQVEQHHEGGAPWCRTAEAHGIC